MAAEASVYNPAADRLSSRDFERLAAFIQSYSGIKMPFAKLTMLEGRLRRRLRNLDFSTLTEYCHYLFEEGGLEAETVHLIDAVSTNKTDFFREPDHFVFLAERAIPALLARRDVTRQSPLRLWSAACSTGAEPYTLAMVAAEMGAANGFATRILATDICTEVLETALSGIYPEPMVEPVPAALRRRYVMRGRGRERDKVRMVPELRSMVAFGRLNLMEAPYPTETGFHAIFCRNVLIYFDKATQKRVLTELCAHLAPGGYLFVGHSETVAGLGLPLVPAGTTIFQLAATP